MQTSLLNLTRALALALATSLVAAPVYADKDKEHGGGKHKKEKKEKHEARDDDNHGSKHFSDEHRTHVRTYYTQEFNAGRCPPGLAKKHNGCMPPGQAKKWNVGQPLPTTVRYYSVPQPVLVQLPQQPSGYRYVRVGNDILLLSPRESLVVDVIRNLGLS